jgi:hypothetical protein
MKKRVLSLIDVAVDVMSENINNELFVAIFQQHVIFHQRFETIHGFLLDFRRDDSVAPQIQQNASGRA